MHIELMRDPAKNFPQVDEPEKVESMRIWHCKYKTLAEITKFKNLKTLVIATYPDETLDVLANLTNLTYLRILHFPKVSSLEPLSQLKNLQTLSLETNPSWDSSRRVLTVDSLSPITQLKKLENLELLGVCTADKSLDALYSMAQLKTARISGYSDKVVSEFFEKSKVIDKFSPEPNQ